MTNTPTLQRNFDVAESRYAPDRVSLLLPPAGEVVSSCQPLSIAHVVRQYRPGTGGLETYVECLAREQVASGHHVRVVTLDRIFHGNRDPLAAEERIDGIDIRRVPFFVSSRYPIAPGVLRHLRDVDIVHVHAIDFLFDYLAITRMLHRMTLVVSTHGGFFHTDFAKWMKRIYFQTVTRTLISQYAYVAASSIHDEHLFRRLRRHGVGLVENGVDVNKFANAAAAAPTRTIISFGRLAPHKNVAALLPFLKRLRERDGDWRLVIAGMQRGTSFDELRTAAEENGVGHVVRMVDSPADVTLLALIGESSVFASASHYEGFGIAAVEALSAGLLPVLSDIPAHRRTVAVANAGALVSFADPDAAVSTFLRYWHDWTSASEMKSSAMTAVRRYAWPHVAQQFEELYRAILGAARRRILEIDINVMRRSELIATIDNAIETRAPLRLVFHNTNLAFHAWRNAALAERLRDCLVVNDGIGTDIASWLLYSRPFPENLNGTDFTPLFLDHTRHQLNLFLLGASPGVADRAAAIIQARWPRHKIVGIHHGFFSEHEKAKVMQAIRASGPDVVLVGMGNPRQELLLGHLCPHLCSCAFATGALFDFLSGEVRRAPGWMQRTRTEWLFRLLQEPARLWRRYLVYSFLFLGLVVHQSLRGDRA